MTTNSQKLVAIASEIIRRNGVGIPREDFAQIVNAFCELADRIHRHQFRNYGRVAGMELSAEPTYEFHPFQYELPLDYSSHAKTPDSNLRRAVDVRPDER